MKITSKGQVTIPQAIRRKAGLLPHTEVEFVVEGRRVFLRRVGKHLSRGEELVRAMTGKGTVKLTTDAIMALTRGEE
ncbi:MAG: AbrB/MazE/SpoVT family DNA-binding domain-containing protein [Planctomycetota bacterium]